MSELSRVLDYPVTAIQSNTERSFEANVAQERRFGNRGLLPEQATVVVVQGHS